MTIHKSYVEQKACVNCKHVLTVWDYEYYCYFEKEKPSTELRRSSVNVDTDLEVEDVGFCQRYKMNPEAFSDATKAKNAITGAIKYFEDDMVYNEIKEAFNFEVVTNGESVTGILCPENGQHLTLMSDDGFSIFPVEKPLAITLTPGTDINLQNNYVYISESRELTVSTSDWPTDKHWKIALVILRYAARQPYRIISYDGRIGNEYGF
jgi:hypothetical protein